jgi:hypothetical protein
MANDFRWCLVLLLLLMPLCHPAAPVFFDWDLLQYRVPARWVRMTAHLPLTSPPLLYCWCCASSLCLFIATSCLLCNVSAVKRLEPPQHVAIVSFPRYVMFVVDLHQSVVLAETCDRAWEVELYIQSWQFIISYVFAIWCKISRKSVWVVKMLNEVADWCSVDIWA